MVADENIDEWRPNLKPIPHSGKDFYKCAAVELPALKQVASAKAVSSAPIPCREFLPMEEAVVMTNQAMLEKFGPIQMDMAIALQRWQYYASLAALLAGALTAAALLSVSLEGWANSALWTKVFFITCSVSTALCFAVPQVYKYEQNIASALKRYNTAFSSLQHIGVVRATGRNPDGTWVVPSDFVSGLSARVIEANGFLVEIDQSKAAIQKIDGPK
jgi:hypothetical protein